MTTKPGTRRIATPNMHRLIQPHETEPNYHRALIQLPTYPVLSPSCDLSSIRIIYLTQRHQKRPKQLPIYAYARRKEPGAVCIHTHTYSALPTTCIHGWQRCGKAHHRHLLFNIVRCHLGSLTHSTRNALLCAQAAENLRCGGMMEAQNGMFGE